MTTPWRTPSKKRDREASSSLSPEPFDDCSFYNEVKRQQAKIITTVKMLEDQIEKRFKAIEEELKSREEQTPKIDALRNAVVEIQEEDIPSLVKEVEEITAAIEAGEKKRKEELQAYLDAEIKKAVAKIVEKTPAAETTNADSAENGLYITGLKSLREKLQLEKNADSAETGLYISGLKKMREVLQEDVNADPCDIVHAALQQVGVSAYYTKIVPVFAAKSGRKDADRAFVYFTSVYHKRLATGELRKALARDGVIGVGIRDVYTKESVPEARELFGIGLQLKRENRINKFRVVNEKNVPKLMTAKGVERYAEIPGELLRTTRERLAGGSGAGAGAGARAGAGSGASAGVGDGDGAGAGAGAS